MKKTKKIICLMLSALITVAMCIGTTISVGAENTSENVIYYDNDLPMPKDLQQITAQNSTNISGGVFDAQVSGAVPKVYISPSNQDANTYTGVATNEMEQCYKFGLALKSALERNGIQVKLAAKGQSNAKSIAESNAFGADIHIPIHTNAGGGEGTLCMVYNYDSKNMALANKVYNGLKSIVPSKKGYGVRTFADVMGFPGQLSELSETNAIGCYVEVDFHDNATIAKWLVNNTSLIAENMCKSICSYFGITYNDGSESTLRGDVDGNKKLTLKDVSLLQQYIGDKVKLTSEQIARGDMNKDSKISITDCTLLQNELS